MTNTRFLRGTKFWIRVFFSISAYFNKIEVKIMTTVRKTILFNEVMRNLPQKIKKISKNQKNVLVKE